VFETLKQLLLSGCLVPLERLLCEQQRAGQVYQSSGLVDFVAVGTVRLRRSVATIAGRAVRFTGGTRDSQTNLEVKLSEEQCFWNKSCWKKPEQIYVTRQRI